MGPLSLYGQLCRNQSDSRAETDLTLSSSSVRRSLVRWSTASSISESSRRPERHSVSVRFNSKLNFHVSAVHCALPTCLLCQQCEHRRGCDLQTGVTLNQSGEHHAAQRWTEGKKHILFCCGGTHTKKTSKEVTVQLWEKMCNVLVWTETTLNRTHRSLTTGCVWPTGRIFELLPVMFVYVNTANKISFPFYTNWLITTHTLVNILGMTLVHLVKTHLPHSTQRTETTGASVKFFLFTCVLPLYCSTREGMTAAVTMWLALLEALQAACSSLALGHTSFRSGSDRWCLQSTKTSYVQGKTKKNWFVKHT